MYTSLQSYLSQFMNFVSVERFAHPNEVFVGKLLWCFTIKQHHYTKLVYINIHRRPFVVLLKTTLSPVNLSTFTVS